VATNAETAYAYLRSAGLSEGAAVGVVGNLIYESGSPSLPTRAKGDGGRATGIAQWHPDRWGNLLSWARSKGKDPYALETQLGYVVVEAQTSTGGNVWGRLKSVTDPVAASALWMRLFERPADQSDAAARARAKRGQDALKNSGGIDWKKVGLAVGLGPIGLLPGVGGAVGGVVDDAVGAATDPIVQGFQGAADSIVKGVQPIVIKGLFVLLGVGLIGAGAYSATRSR
jgi:hypothetical protein